MIELYNDARKGRGGSVGTRRYPAKVPLQRDPEQHRDRIRFAWALPDDPDGLRRRQLRHRLWLRHDPLGPHRSDAGRRSGLVLAHHLYGIRAAGAIAPERCQPFDKNRKGMVPGRRRGGAGARAARRRRSARRHHLRRSAGVRRQLRFASHDGGASAGGWRDPGHGHGAQGERKRPATSITSARTAPALRPTIAWKPSPYARCSASARRRCR